MLNHTCLFSAIQSFNSKVSQEMTSIFFFNFRANFNSCPEGWEQNIKQDVHALECFHASPPAGWHFITSSYLKRRKP